MGGNHPRKGVDAPGRLEQNLEGGLEQGPGPQTKGTRHRRPASGSLLITDVEVQAAACRDRVDQGLQLRGSGALDHACHQR